MSVYHCPLCPLIFQYRTEAEWHLREEHRSRTDEAAELRSELAGAVRQLDSAYLSHLRSMRSTPSVTLLLSTAPAATMSALDIARLRQLAERARRRLAAEPHREAAVSVVEERLSRVVSAAESQPTDRGLAVVASQEHLGILALPFGPRDRHIVDDGFATRDLEYALRRYRRHRIVVLGHHPRILEGHAQQLSDASAGGSRRGPRVVPGSPPGAHRDADALIDERIGAAGNLPLVVVGDRRDLERFRLRSRHATDVVAEVPRPRLHRVNVGDLVTDALNRIHHQQQSAALSRLLHADIQSQIAWGVQAAWNAIQNRAADRLWVEHDYAVPARVTPGATGIETIADPAEPGAIDDVVDALLARAAEAGIETHLLDRHILDRADPVAVNIPIPTPSFGVPRPRSMATT